MYHRFKTPLTLSMLAVTLCRFALGQTQENDRSVAVKNLLERCTVVVQGFDPQEAQEALTSPHVMQEQAKRRYSIYKSLFQTNDLLRHKFDQMEERETESWPTDEHVDRSFGYESDFSDEVERNASDQDPRNLALVLRPKEAMHVKKKRLKSPFFSRIDKDQMVKIPDHQGLCILPHPNQDGRFILFFVALDTKQLHKLVQNTQHMDVAGALTYTPPKN